MDFEPCFSLGPNTISFYQVPIPDPLNPRRKNFQDKFDLSETDNSDNLSTASVMKLVSYINWFCEQAKFKSLQKDNFRKGIYYKLGFLTLDLPFQQHHDDVTIKHDLLNHFMIEMKKQWFVKNYIWRAEKQKNGNIHFHIIIDRFVDYAWIRNTWNRVCDKLDYVQLFAASQAKKFEFGFTYSDDDYNYLKLKLKGDKKFFKYSQIDLDRFIRETLHRRYTEGKKTGWQNPNSTDIHCLRKIRNVGSYLAKYCAKRETKQIIITDSQGNLSTKEEIQVVKGRQWYCSKGIVENCKNYKDYQEDIFDKEFTDIWTNGEKVFSNDFIDTFKIDWKDKKNKYKELAKVMSAHLFNMNIELNK